MAVGLLGGVFDPPHLGHVALARAAIAQLALERLLVSVIADPGHKRATTPVDTRLELTRLAFAGVPEVSIELDGHARTVDSLEARMPEGAVFIIGADELVRFASWKRPERVLELVRLAVATRPGTPDERVREARAALPDPERVVFFEMPAMPMSSSEIRARVARGQSIEGLVSPRVASEIARLGLYASAE